VVCYICVATVSLYMSVHLPDSAILTNEHVSNIVGTDGDVDNDNMLLTRCYFERLSKKLTIAQAFSTTAIFLNH